MDNKRIKEILYNLEIGENGNEDLSPISAATYRGMIVAIIACAPTFHEGVKMVYENLPVNHIDLGLVLPESLCEAFGATYGGRHATKKPMGTLKEIVPETKHVEITVAVLNFCKRRIGYGDLKNVLKKHGMLE